MIFQEKRMSRFYTNVQAFGDTVYARVIENGKRKKFKVKYQPTLFVPSKKPTAFRTLDNEFLSPLVVGSMKETKEHLKQYEDVPNFKIYGHTQFQYPYIADNWPEENITYDMKQLVIVNVDIECECEKGFPQVSNPIERINAITLKVNGHKYVFGLGKYTPTEKNVTYYDFEDEAEMLKDFMNLWVKLEPDIVTGWYVKTFDIPYMVNRMERLIEEGFSKGLSPWKYISPRTLNLWGQDYQTYDITGVSVIDYFVIYKKYQLEPRESYRLDNIAEVELKRKKVSYKEYENYRDFYKQDWNKFIEYNMVDVDLVDALEDKLKFIELTIEMAYFAHVNYEDVASQVRTWDNIIYNHLRRKGIVIPLKTEQHKDIAYAGAYVKDPPVGLHKWVVSFDVTSLYPSIIRVLNIGTETKLNKLWDPCGPDEMLNNTESFQRALADCQKVNFTVSSNGCMYRKDHISFFSEMIKILFDRRIANKKEAGVWKKKVEELKAVMQEAKGQVDVEVIENLKEANNNAAKFGLKEKAQKIALNSLYGAMGNEYFRFFDVQNATAVTLTGQFIIQFIERGMNQFLQQVLKTTNNYVLYCDTDSVYITLDELVQKVCKDPNDLGRIVDFLDKVCKQELEPHLEKMFADLTENYINGMPGGILTMKREVIANKAVWMAKKRYILNVQDTEGLRHKESKLKIMGVEISKSSTPMFCRDAMKTAVGLMMNKTEKDVIDFIAETKIKFKTLPAHQIAFPRSVSGLDKWTGTNELYVKGTPINTKGALIYNELVEKLGLAGKYQKIAEGEKIKFVYLKLPNPVRDKVIAFLNELPPEFGLDKYIDYELQWEKTFLDPLNVILKAAKMESEHRATLDSFFV
jgi:DNA polymerase elongation subunit (family B)